MDVQTIIAAINQAKAKADAATERARLKEADLLARYAEKNRMYPDGHTFLCMGRMVIITGALSAIDGDSIHIAYALYFNGEPFTVLSEKNVGNPMYE